nr:transposase [uncultured Gammaproteobacteria bacterium]
MKLRWTFRCYPTKEQEQVLARTFGCVRFVYNRFLHERTAAFARGERMNYVQTSAALTQLKSDPEYAWLNEVSSVPLQQSLRHLQTAFRNFFDKRAGYPTFKKKSGQQSAEYTRSAFRFEIDNQRLLITKLGRLKVKWSRRVYVDPTTVTIIKNPSGRYFVSLVVDIHPPPLPETSKEVALDFGLNHLATLSNGEKINNPRYLQKYLKKLAKAQKLLSRKQKGSKRYEKARIRVAKVHEKISNSREDPQKKLAWMLVQRFDTIYLEDLNLRGLSKNHALARSLQDVAIGGYIRMIEAKAAMHGKRVIKVDRFFPSTRMCCRCGQLHPMPLSKRWMECDCGNGMDRDLNAAINLLAAGQAVTARGDGVRPDLTSVRLGSCL